MAGLLGDIYSTIDSTKRKLSDFVQNPVESTRQFIFNRNEDAGKQLGLLDQSFRGANGQLTIGPQTPQAQAAHNQLTDGLLSAMMGATVWHGSPHKFNKFDSSKIGTGEGAQAYGHGLYLAESPDVAKGYSLMADQNPTAQQYLRMWGGDRTKAEAAFMKDVQEGAFGKYTTQIASNGDVVASIRGKGQIYKVDLPDEHIAKMLDWDKPLSQQPQSVQAAFGSVDPNGRINTGLAYERWRAQQGVDPVAASEKLKALGIPGVKYLDGGSRGTGAGTSNYVVFPGNEDILKILERNGKGLLD